MTQAKTAIAHSTQMFTSGRFETALAHLVAITSESQVPDNQAALRRYLTGAITPLIAPLGFDVQIFENPVSGGGPILVAKRLEDPAQHTVLIYGHGDVVYGQAGKWDNNRDPFELSDAGDRWFGRGSADNKAQHLINILALEAVIAAQGALGFNCTLLIEMSEEIGSVGLAEFCAQNAEALKADVLIASDGPRVHPDTPTVFLGARGSVNFELSVPLRDGARHSGNWGGLLVDPAMVLAQALACLCDETGQILVPEWRPKGLGPEVRTDLADIPPLAGAEDWGERGLTPNERVYDWNSFAVLALISGVPEAPQNAIAGHAKATCQLRFVMGTDEAQIMAGLRRHLDGHGFAHVQINELGGVFPASRQDRDNPWVTAVVESIKATAGACHVLPNLAGWIPNHCFSQVLGLPTVWVPHSYGGCSQHAPNEHVLKSVCQDGLRVMAGVFADLGDMDV